MALVLANRVQETTATTGTGTITLAGAVAGYQSFAAIGNANTTYYTITSGTAWEVGIGTYTSSGTTLSRDTVLSSSAGGTTKITLAGTSTVFADYPAEKVISDGYGLLPVANGGTGQSSYTNGQLLIGNTTGNTLTKTTLTAGTNVSITNGSGAITINATDAFVGTVTSVGGTGTVNGITLTGTVTTSGSLTLGGTLSGVSLTSQVTGTLPVANGGTGATTLTSGYLLKGNGTSAVSASVVYDTGTNVGIGTSAPGTKLDVAGTITSRGDGTEGGQITLNNAANSASACFFDVDGSGHGRVFTTTNNTNLYLGQLSGTGGVLVMYTGAAERMRIDSSGNVGIGTSSPSSKLDVNGKVTLTGGEDQQLQWTNNSQTWRLNNSIAGRLYFYDVTGAKFPFGIAAGTPNDTLALTSTGDVGIGTSAPGGKLHVVSGTNDSILFRGPISLATGGSMYGVNAANTAIAPLEFAASAFYFNAGNVGIGTSSPGYKLVVSAASNTNPIAVISGSTKGIRLGADANGGIIEGVDNTGAASYQPMTLGGADIRLTTSGTERARIDSSGNVGIGTTAPGAALHVFGNNGVFGTNSFFGLNGSTSGIAIGNNGSIGLIQGQTTASAATAANIGIQVNGGNVGVGTGTPGGKLHTQLATSFSWGSNWGTGTAVFGGASASTGALGLSYNDTDGAGIGAIAPGVAWKNINFYSNQLIFNTNGATERMRIDSSGNVGIGTSSPGQKLDVVGIVLAREDNSAGATPVLLRNSNTGNNTTKSSSALFQGTDTVGTVKNIGSIGFFPDDANYIGANLRFLVRSGDTTPTEQLRILSTGGITSASLADAVGYKGLPQNSQTASYTLALTDMGKMVNTTTGGVIIPANSSVAFPIGSAISIYNNSASSQTISITTDTIYLAGTATTGSRTLAQRGLATCVKVASTTWVVSGAGVT